MVRNKSVCAVFTVLVLTGTLLVAAPASFAQPAPGPSSPMTLISPPAAPGQARKPALALLTPDQVHRKVLNTIVVALLCYLVLFLLIGIINRRIPDIKARHQARKNAIYFINIVLILAILALWLQNINSVTLILGFISAGLALALQEAILCVAGWFLILTRRPFDTGDRVEINGIRGDVIDIRLFQTSLLEIGNWVDADQSTGRIVNVPNSFVFKHANYNYSQGFEFIWNEIPILLTFESDWKRGREIMLALGEKIAQGQADDVSRKIEVMKNRYMIYYGKLTPIVYVAIKDSGILLTLRYLTEAKKRRYTHDQICRELLDAFSAEPGVTFAYPTYRIVKD